ncbi:hypothetical protein [Persicirhabdus sediminis]|uniref:Uncharacterized protein n=1 Tax=Persicirhabdus sediminis TaxID=454144 RepID=A0A8J7MG70_9BACT|nr:hypothetical protein [Persicirhabdus sediminis]MBK1792290.1 hypothetical protein [Persicirhabdus sediminis]
MNQLESANDQEQAHRDALIAARERVSTPEEQANAIGLSFEEQIRQWKKSKQEAAQAAQASEQAAVVAEAKAVIQPAAEAPAKVENPPVAEVVKPVVEEVKPVAEVAQPVVEQVKPVAEVAKPVVEEVKPVAEVAKPVVEEVKPVAEVAKPVVEEEKPAAEEEKPAEAAGGQSLLEQFLSASKARAEQGESADLSSLTGTQAINVESSPSRPLASQTTAQVRPLTGAQQAAMARAHAAQVRSARIDVKPHHGANLPASARPQREARPSVSVSEHLKKFSPPPQAE